MRSQSSFNILWKTIAFIFLKIGYVAPAEKGKVKLYISCDPPKVGHTVWSKKKIRFMYFFNITSVFTPCFRCIEQTEYKVMKSKGGTTKVVNFMTQGEWLLCLGILVIYAKMHYFLTPSSPSDKNSVKKCNSIYSNLVLI